MRPSAPVALKQAVKEWIMTYNPCDNCRIPPKEKKEMAIILLEKLGEYISVRRRSAASCPCSSWSCPAARGRGSCWRSGGMT